MTAGTLPSRIVLAASLISMTACASAPKQTTVMAQLPNLVADIQELRFRAYSLADELSGLVEAGADEIATGTANPDIRFKALLWKANGVPAIRTASFQRDPFAASLDLWALAVQMNAFFEQGAGRALFEDLQPIAVQTSREMVSRSRALASAAATAEGVENGAQTVQEWADAHPIRDLLFARTSVAELWADVAERRTRVLAAVADINAQVADLLHRLTVYSALLPKEARWQAELLLNEIKNDPTSQALLDDVSSLEAEIDAIGDTALALEGHVETASDTLAGAEELITSQRLAAVQTLQTELANALSRLTEERVAVMDRITEERIALLVGIQAERVALLQAVTAERAAVMSQLDDLSRRVTDDGTSAAMAAVDHFFVRTAQLLVVVALIAGTAVFAVRRRHRNDQPPATS